MGALYGAGIMLNACVYFVTYNALTGSGYLDGVIDVTNPTNLLILSGLGAIAGATVGSSGVCHRTRVKND